MQPGIFAEDIVSGVTRDECHRLSALAAGKVFLELGSQFGRSTIAIASTASRVHAVDWHRGDNHAGFVDSLPQFLANLDRYAVRNQVIVHLGKNEDILPAFRPGQFDAAFIDSFHTEDAVRSDTQLVLPLVKRNGVIAFHDFNVTQFPGVKHVVESLVAEKECHLEVVDHLAVVSLR